MSKPVISHLLPIGLLTAAAMTASAAPTPTPPTPSARAKPEIAPEADRLLKQMTTYLASLQTFRVQSSSADEIVTKSGQKIQLVADSLVSVERPNRLRSEQLGQSARLSYWYDGKAMTLFCKSNNTFGIVSAPPTLDGAIDLARKQYDIDAPGADLLFSHPYDVLTEQVTSGQVIGRETVDGVAVNHLAFVGEEVDWQIWIQEGSEPLPLRFVITTKTMKERPQFEIQLSHWEPRAKLAASTFAFTPPPGATRSPTLPTTCPAPR